MTLQILVGLSSSSSWILWCYSSMSAEPGHMGGHTLDLVMSKDGSDIIHPGSVVISNMLSNHSLVLCVLDLEPPPHVKQMCKYHRLGAIDQAAFQEDLQTPLVDPEKDIGALVGQQCRDLCGCSWKACVWQVRSVACQTTRVVVCWRD